MKINILALFFLISIFIPQGVKASHLRGGEISYKWLGGKKYQVNIKIYRDCRGIALNSPMFRMFNDQGDSLIYSATRVSIEDVTNICKDSSTRCYPQNQTTGNMGIEIHHYTSTIDFAASPYSSFMSNSCKVYFSVEQCCISWGITMQDLNFYIESMLDVCLTNYHNSSPQFNSIPFFEVDCNVPVRQSVSAIDPADYDSISHEVSQPIDAHNSYPYNPGYAIPLTPFCPPNNYTVKCTPIPNIKTPIGFYFDKPSGNMVFTPIKCDELSTIFIKVKEFRKINGTMQLVGASMRSTHIVVLVRNTTPVNFTPEMSGNTDYQFQVGKNKCIDFTTLDTLLIGQSQGDSTLIKATGLPPGSTFTYTNSSAKNKTGRFCWTAHDSVYKKDFQEYVFNLLVKDNYCPFPQMIQKGIRIVLSPFDSTGKVKVLTYIDDNGNNKKDAGEEIVKAPVYIKFKNWTRFFETDADGQLEQELPVGSARISSHAFGAGSQTLDTILQVILDSNHVVQLAVKRPAGIHGRIYEDKNANCTYDAGEPVFEDIIVKTNKGNHVSLSDGDGKYLLSPDSGTYTVSVPVNIKKYTLQCNSSKTLYVKRDTAYRNIDFALTRVLSYNDISVLTKWDRLRRGAITRGSIVVENMGSKTVKNIKAYMPVPSLLALYDISGNPIYLDTVVLKIDSLKVNQTFTYYFSFNVDANNFKSGQSICFKNFMDATTNASDSLPANNTFNACGTVTTAYDPNEKLLLDNRDLTYSDHTISYTVHFQNTGNDTAMQVIVRDTINTQFLDLEQFKLNWSDYPCKTYMRENVLVFVFDNIQLPYQSLSGDKSQAAFNFTLGLRPVAKKETSFNNKAAIFFDYEDAVITKPAVAKYVSPLKIRDISTTSICNNQKGAVSYFSVLPLNINNTMELQISDINGSFAQAITIGSQQNSESNGSIDFSIPGNLAEGNYLLRLVSSSPALESIPDSGYMALQVNHKPDGQGISNLRNNSICDNEKLKLQLSYAGAEFKIYKNNVLDLQQQDYVNYETSVAANDKFIVYSTDLGNACSDTMFLSPDVLKSPDVSLGIMNRKANYCELDLLMLNMMGADKYDVLKDGSLKDTSLVYYGEILRNPAVYVYQVIGRAQNGCSNYSDTVMVNVVPLPGKPVITASVNTLSVNFTGTVKWYKDGVFVTQGNMMPNAPSGSYTVEVISSEGCMNTSNAYQHQNTGIKTVTAQNITVYPNPASESLTVEHDLKGVLEFSMTDLSGKLVLKQDIEGHSQVIDISDITPGLYLVTFSGEVGISRHLIRIER